MDKRKMKISDNIKILRESLNYSQEYVAAKLDISQQAYSLIEKNPEKTSLKNLREIANILHVRVSSLILEDEQYVQHNFNHQQCNIASQLNLSSNEVYEKLISKLENEIYYLRGLIEKKSDLVIATNTISK